MESKSFEFSAREYARPTSLNQGSPLPLSNTCLARRYHGTILVSSRLRRSQRLFILASSENYEHDSSSRGGHRRRRTNRLLAPFPHRFRRDVRPEPAGHSAPD